MKEASGKQIGRFARHLRRNQTDAERKFWQLLRSRELCGFKFRRQHPIGSYIADFCCIEKKLIVELDGGQHAARHLQDQRRTEYLNSRGYEVLRFWDHDILLNTEAVVEAVRLALMK